MDKLKELIKVIDNKQGDEIEVLDFRKNSPFVDYFIICSARNCRLANAIIDEVEDFAYKNNLEVKSKNIGKEDKWMLIDLNDIVVHVFVGDEREKYSLEKLWKDLLIEI